MERVSVDPSTTQEGCAYQIFFSSFLFLDYACICHRASGTSGLFLMP